MIDIPYVLLLVVFSIVGKPILLIIALILLLAPPIIGYLIGRRKSKAELAR